MNITQLKNLEMHMHNQFHHLQISQWPEVDIEFSLCAPLMRRKAGKPKQSSYKAWFEKGGSSKKGKKD